MRTRIHRHRTQPSLLARSRFAPALSALAFTLFLAAGAAPVQAQSPRSEDVAAAQIPAAAFRPVGREGRLSRVNWRAASMLELRDMRLEGTLTRLSKTPGVLRHTKIWMARADVCDTVGEEVLVQIRSPLTCGSAGCEIMVLSDAGPTPRVMLQTVGDTIDAPFTDELVINRGSPLERSWRYSGDRFQRK